jgi:hypothetical protein
MRDNAVPEIIRAAGDDAARAYREFLDDPKWSAGTRKGYRQSIRRFMLWAEGKGLALNTTTSAEVGAYATEIAARSSPQMEYVRLTPVRGLFRHLVGSGVLSVSPCENPLSITCIRLALIARIARKTHTRKKVHQIPDASFDVSEFAVVEMLQPVAFTARRQEATRPQNVVRS